MIEDCPLPLWVQPYLLAVHYPSLSSGACLLQQCICTIYTDICYKLWQQRYYLKAFSRSRMLSKAKKYAEFGATSSPHSQRRQPAISEKPSAFSLLLLEISKHCGEKDMKNFTTFLEDYGRENDKGAVKQLKKVTTMYSLLMKSAKMGFIQPDDLSNLVAFLDICGRCGLVQEIRDFQVIEQSKCTLL